MPIVPAGYAVPRAPSVDPLATAPDAAQQIRAPAGAFGSLTAQALSQFGTAAERASDAWTKIGQYHDNTVADEQVNAAMDRVNKLRFGDPDKPDDVGFHGLADRAVMDGYQPYRQSVDAVLQEGRAKLTPQQQQRYDERMRPYRTHIAEEAGKHYAASAVDYRKKEFNSSLGVNSLNAQGAAAGGNQAAFEEYNAQDNKLIDESPDLTPTQKEELKGKRRKEAAKDWTTGMISRGDYEGADRFVDNNQKVLGDYTQTLKEHLRGHRERAEAHRGVGDILGGGTGGGVVVRNGPVEERINQAASAEGISPQLAMTVASIESNFGRAADRAGSQYQGVYQLGRDAQAQVGGKDVEHGVRFLAQTKKDLTDKLGRAPADWEVYLAHQQGTAGASALLANPNQSAADALAPAYGGNRDQAARAIGGNGGNPDAPASQFVQKWRNTYESRSAKLGAPGAAPSPTATTAPSTPPAAAGAPEPITAVGDSLAAHLVRRGGAQGKEDAARVGSYREGDTAVSGWNPTRVLNDIIPKLPAERVNGHSVALSTGISNAANAQEVQTALNETIPAQIAALREKGAKNIVLMGVGTDPKLAGVNDRLAQIAKENAGVGVTFAGPQRKTGGDRIHSSDQGAEMAAVRQALGGTARPAGEPTPTTGSSTPPAMPPGATMRPNPFADRPAGTPGAPPATSPPATPGAAPAPAPDMRPPVARLDENIAEVNRRLAAGQISSPEVADKMIAGLTHEYNKWQHQTAQERTALGKELKDTEAALKDGKNVPVDQARITRLLPPAAAAEAIEVLDDARTGGGYISTIRTSSPQDIAAQRQRLAAGLDDPTANNYARRKRLVDIYDEQRARHFTELGKDPGKYVAAYSPDVAAAYRAAFPNGSIPTDPDPLVFSRYAHATLAEQARLGVPESKRAILPEAQTAAIAEQITRIDPAKTDPAQTIGAIAQSFGAGSGTNDHWPQVFDELVRAKLPGPYQVIANMDRGDQKVAAADLSRSLATIAHKGGMATVKAGAGEQIKDIDKEIVSQLEDFRHSTGPQSAGEDLHKRVEEAAQALAYYYAYRGESAAQAAKHAVDGIINAKYDFGNFGNYTVRVPKTGDKSMVSDTQTAADRVLRDLTADQLPPIPGSPYLRPEQHKALWLENIQAGGWVNNGNDTGIVLMAQLRQGGLVPVRRSDGSPVVLLFKDVQPIVGTAAEPPIEGPAIRHWREFGRPAPGGGLAPAPVPVPGMMEPAALQ
jgi:hypothetical protein